MKLVDLVDNVFPPINAAIERDRLVNAQLRAELEKERQRAAESSKLDELASSVSSGSSLVPPPVPPRPPAMYNTSTIPETPAESEEFNDFFFWKQPVGLPDPSLYSHLSSPSLLPLSPSDMLLLPAGGEHEGGEGDDGQASPVHDDETSSERGDHYYFEEREEAGLIPFA